MTHRSRARARLAQWAHCLVRLHRPMLLRNWELTGGRLTVHTRFYGCRDCPFGSWTR